MTDKSSHQPGAGAKQGLDAQGFHFFVSTDRRESKWVHPAEIPQLGKRWKDTSGMTDAEFEDWMARGAE